MKKGWLTAVIPITAIVLLTLLGLFGEDSKEQKKAVENDSSVPVNAAMKEGSKSLLVTMINTKGETIGEARLEQKPDGVKINLDASKLPQGIHGFHIHENGSCDTPDFESAGGHFNPTNAKHGFDTPGGPHAGDLPNIQVKAYGNVSTSVLAEMVTLERGKENSLLKEGGTALIIHSRADDYKSQPAGNAGERIACGVIAE